MTIRRVVNYVLPYIYSIVGIVEIVAVLYWSIYGGNGFNKIAEMNSANQSILAHIHTIKQEVADIERQIGLIKAGSFVYEKIAREDLYMARAEELVFLIPSDQVIAN